MIESNRYRIVQHGIPVAWTEGPTALQEIMHYQMIYRQDGPCKVEMHRGGKWINWPPAAERVG